MRQHSFFPYPRFTTISEDLNKMDLRIESFAVFEISCFYDNKLMVLTLSCTVFVLPTYVLPFVNQDFP